MSAKHYDGAAAVMDYDDTKAGVKGLVDAGVAKIPPCFIQLPEQSQLGPTPQIPVIDLTGAGISGAQRERAVAQVLQAAATFGFFQVVNHGIPNEVLDEMLRAAARFHEEPVEVKRPFYTRDPRRKVQYQSNFDLYTAPVINWKDTLQCNMAPDPPHPEELPAACRKGLLEFTGHVQKLGAVLFHLLSEGLGLGSERLLKMECADGLLVRCHYYPPCPEPELTHGFCKHSDPDFLTIILQDQIGGLQVLHQDQWIDMPPLPGSLVVNLGDQLQVLHQNQIFHCIALKLGYNKIVENSA